MRRLSVVVLGIALLFTSVVGSASASRPTTRLTIHVAGCSTCRVTLVQAIPRGPSWHSRAKRVGSDHVVTFTVPTRRTHGMSFEVRAPWESFTDSVLNVVTRYATERPGEHWSAHRAKHAQRAYGCWAGTTHRRASLRFRVARFPFTSHINGTHRATGAVAWASPALHTRGEAVDTWHGRIGNQDAFYCPR
jgi:hypothetical protein